MFSAAHLAQMVYTVIHIIGAVISSKAEEALALIMHRGNTLEGLCGCGEDQLVPHGGWFSTPSNAGLHKITLDPVREPGQRAVTVERAGESCEVGEAIGIHLHYLIDIQLSGVGGNAGWDVLQPSPRAPHHRTLAVTLGWALLLHPQATHLVSCRKVDVGVSSSHGDRSLEHLD
ncbi:hypothetical protein E2C01_023230 [Portunus trituberculatus]|uniref:Uncharacterized protein n=1 Tax=Portunus trituberculatus TaxID=210409 RepID=A0A5B7E9F3_PORTR|nr:hypothetical protein [Portunus trituberculatus]